MYVVPPSLIFLLLGSFSLHVNDKKPQRNQERFYGTCYFILTQANAEGPFSAFLSREERINFKLTVSLDKNWQSQVALPIVVLIETYNKLIQCLKN